jgi:hypothetical protein
MTKRKKPTEHQQPARRPATDDVDAVRAEAIALLKGDRGLTDNLQIDLVSTLRMAIDAAHARASAGERVDLAQLLVAEERLRSLLPPARALPDTKLAEHQRRQAALQPVIAYVRGLHEQIAALTQENVTLRAAARSALAPAPGAAPVEAAPAAPAANNVVPMPRAPASAAPAAPGYDYDANSDWKSYVNSDGSIRSTPRGGGHDWGPA